MRNPALEYRSVSLSDVAVDMEKRTIVGKAIPFESFSSEMRGTDGVRFKEIIKPDAIMNSLAKNDIVAFKEHNPEMILGRASAGTLRMEKRSDGLYVAIDVPNTTYGNDLLVSAERKDIGGFSFGFGNAKGTRSVGKDGVSTMTINDMDLREVSVTSMPAYPSTNLSLRSEGFIDETPIVETPTDIYDTEYESIRHERLLKGFGV